nr:NAD(P)H-binding protein [Amycolatopsis anabasis]
MKVTVFGAIGETGGHLVRRALAAGHQVTADVFDPAAIESAVSGRDAVISTLGTRDRNPTTLRRDATRSLITAMRAAGADRLVVVSASGFHFEGDGLLVRAGFKPLLGRLLRNMFEDMREMRRG